MMSDYPKDIYDTAANIAEHWAEPLYDDSTSDSEAQEVVDAIADAILAERCRFSDGLRGCWHGIYLDGRNEHGSHVIRLPQRSIELEQDDDGNFLKDLAETILQDAEGLGFSVGDAVIAMFYTCNDEGFFSHYEYVGISPELTAQFYGTPEDQSAEKDK
jgi:hypothetical protein